MLYNSPKVDTPSNKTKKFQSKLMKYIAILPVFIFLTLSMFSLVSTAVMKLGVLFYTNLFQVVA